MARSLPEALPRRGAGIGRLFRNRREGSRPGYSAPAIDPESRLANEHELYSQLRREMARSRRHGDRSVLVVFDIRPVPHGDGSAAGLPSPVGHMAGVLAASTREADIVGRLDVTHFAVLLTDCDREGARLFVERVRTRISSTPYARGEQFGDVYVRAWAGFTPWEREIAEPEQYVAAAMAELQRSRPRHEFPSPWVQSGVR